MGTELQQRPPQQQLEEVKIRYECKEANCNYGTKDKEYFLYHLTVLHQQQFLDSVKEKQYLTSCQKVYPVNEPSPAQGKSEHLFNI